MQTITVNRDELLTKVRTNRAEHRDVFLKAQVKFREAVIDRLDVMLTDAREGRQVRQHVGLVAPEDHTKDYDVVVAMLEMSVGDTIEISQNEFQQYVMDQWQWARQFGATVGSYGISNKYLDVSSYEGE
jgi:hypothetical protein